jgi:hypothetical protein
VNRHKTAVILTLEEQDDAMNTHILNGHVNTAEIEWKPLVESGVDTKGISVKALRIDPITGRAPSFLLRFEPVRTIPITTIQRARNSSCCMEAV